MRLNAETRSLMPARRGAIRSASRRSTAVALVLALLAGSSCAPHAFAASGSWNVNGSGNWNTAANWTPNSAVPGTTAGDVVGLVNNITTNSTVTIDTNVILGALNIGDNNGSNSFTLDLTTGGTLTFNNNGSGAAIQQASTSNANTISAGFTLADNLTVTNAATSFALTLSGNIGESGARSLTKAGAGTLVLSGSNSYSGGTTLSAGRLNLNNANAIGTGTFTISGGTIDNTSNSSITLATNNDQAWNGDFTFAGSNPLNLGTGTATFAANRQVTVTSSTLTVGSVVGAGSSQFTKLGNGTLVITGSSTMPNWANFRSGTTTLSGGSLTFNGRLNVGDNAGFNGTLLVSSGTAAVNSTSYIGGASSGAVGSLIVESGVVSHTGATMYVGQQGTGTFSQSGGSSSFGTVYLGFQGGSGSVLISGGTATMSLDMRAANGPGGNGSASLTVQGGSVSIGASARNFASGTNSNASILLSGGTLSMGGLSTTRGPGSTSMVTFDGGVLQASAASATYMQALTNAYITNNGALIDTNGFDITIAQALTNGTAVGTNGFLRKSGAGTLTLSGSNSFTGTTRVQAGTISITNTNALQNSTLDMNSEDSGTVTFSQASTLGGLTGSRNLDMGTRTLSIGNNGASTTYSGTLSNGALTKVGSGTLTLTGANTYGGVTTLSAGVVNLGSAETAGTSGPLGKPTTSANSIVLAGGTLQYSASNSNDYSARFSSAASQAYNVDTNGQNVTWASNLASTGGVLKKIGSGTLTLSGSNALAAGVTVGLGQLLVNNANALGTGTTTVAGGELNIGSYAPSVGGFTITSGSLTGSGTVTATNGYALQGGAINAKLGSGAITVSAGTTTLGSAGRLNSASGLTVSSGQLSLGGNETVASYTQSGGTLGGTGKISAATYGLGGGTVSANLGGGTVTVTADSTLGGTSDATTVNLNAGTLTLGGASRFTSSSVAVSGSAGAALTLGGNEAFGSLDGAANIALGANTLSVGGLGTSTNYSGNLTGFGVFAKLGTGTVTLSGANAHSGGTQIANGVLRLGSSTALPASSAVTLGTGSTAGALEFNGNTATLGAITFNGSGSQLSDTGKLNLLASGTANATITVTSGSHALHPDTTLQSNTVIDLAPGSYFSLHGDIDGSKSLTQIGSGTLAIYGANSYSGGTYLSSGYMSVQNTGALGSGTVTIDGNSILNLNNTILTNTVVFGSGSGAVINAGSLVNVTGTYAINSGTGTSITTNYSVQSDGDISFVSNLASTVYVQGTAQGTFSSDVLGGGTVIVNAGGRGVFSGGMSGNVTTSGSALFSGDVLGNVTVAGGTATFAAATGPASAINVNSGLGVVTGTIGSIAHATAAGAILEIRGRVLSTADVNAEAGATVKLMGSEAFDGTTIDNGGSVIVNRTANFTLGAVISGSGSLTKSDATMLTLTGNNTYSGLTTISGGTLSVGGGGTSGSLAGDVLNNAALVFNRSNDAIYAGNISGSGGFTKLGAGKLSLTGSSSYSGGTTVQGGVLAVNGQIGGNATVLAGGTLGGSGSIAGVLSGAGLVGPGNSPGILTASQFDPSGGLDAAFEFTGLSPVYTSSTASLNDVLRLTNLSDPFASGTFTAGNVIDVYFNVDSIVSGQIYEGGFFTGLSAEDLLAALDGKATFNYWAKTAGTADRTYGGFNYVSLTSLSGITGVTFQTGTRTADFGSGNVTGSVTQFVIVPEPAAIVLASIGAGLVGLMFSNRRRHHGQRRAPGRI